MSQREGYKKTEIGWIPEDWDVVSLGSIVKKIEGGGTPSRERDDYYNGDIPWITVKDLSKNIFYKDSAIEYISQEGLKNSSANLVQRDNIIISTRMGLGKGFINTIDMAINQDMKAVYLDFGLMSNIFFLYWYLSKSIYIESLGTGTTVKGISLITLKKLLLPLPPLPEQQKIASILTTIDDKISSIDQQIQQTEQLKKGLMEKLLTEGIGHTEFKDTEIGRIPEGWDVVGLMKMASRKKNSFVNGPFGSDLLSSELISSGVPVIYIRDIVTQNYNRRSTVCVTPDKADSLLFCNVQYNDVLVTKVGMPPGQATVYQENERAIITQDVIRIRPSSKTCSSFLSALLNSDYARKEIKKIEITGTRTRFSLTQYKKIKLPYPPLQEQKQIASILSGVDDKIETLTQKKSEYQTLKKGLMAELLTGKRRVKV